MEHLKESTVSLYKWPLPSIEGYFDFARKDLGSSQRQPSSFQLSSDSYCLVSEQKIDSPRRDKILVSCGRDLTYYVASSETASLGGKSHLNGGIPDDTMSMSTAILCQERNHSREYF